MLKTIFELWSSLSKLDISFSIKKRSIQHETCDEVTDTLNYGAVFAKFL